MKSPLLILLAVVALALLAWLGYRSQCTLERGLPPRTVHATAAEALAHAQAHVAVHGGAIRPVAGTGSMAPYIPASAADLDPRTTVVAYAVTVPGATFDDITPGALCLYAAAWQPTLNVIHGAALQDAAGWIMSGLANDRSEAAWRVTPANFRGLVAHVFVISQPKIP
jgi:hypothetical protein